MWRLTEVTAISLLQRSHFFTGMTLFCDMFVWLSLSAAGAALPYRRELFNQPRHTEFAASTMCSVDLGDDHVAMNILFHHLFPPCYILSYNDLSDSHA